ncbi:sugar phosphate isomerase/epimerase [Paenibacillus sp. PK3_47]|uniref:sugar phosphate isomerase/epimerase family protein n=1 Tax=Paenibacillus sp. PK3_47 TaxID=2072642 RepID=UPI00201DE22C|nr:sugar phosphate isomerase/epimerase [Paenibacillus sp. PK3_47]UQZ36897.1 sugar phosphate isomerase/epimerase [Paenibacillus sp. PK3_47]
MKLGVSTYSLYKAIQAGEMSVLDVIEWTASAGGEHVEIVPVGYNLYEQEGLAEQIRSKAEAYGIELSNYAVRGNLITDSEESFRAEIERLKREVDMAVRLGVKLVRHDAATHPDISVQHYLAQLPRLADGCREIADYAAGFGITTSIENHGTFLQSSDRVLGLVTTVGRDNFRTTLDVGNFVCVDEDPLAAVKKNAPYASMVHYKDFYIRPEGRGLGGSWFRSTAGRYLLGAVAGYGDLELEEITGVIKNSGYNGYVSIEFEGLEECRSATRLAMDNVRRLWEQA